MAARLTKHLTKSMAKYMANMFSGQKFKDFPGPHFEISRTFLWANLPTAKQNVCV